MRKQKRLIKLVAVTLMIALMVPMAAFASVQELTFDTTKKGVSLAGKYPAYDDIALQYSMTEDASHKITIPTKLEADKLAAAVKANQISFSLVRDTDRPYLDPTLYPYAKKGGALSEWKDQDGKEVFHVKEMTADGTNLVVTFETTGMLYYKNENAKGTASEKVYTIPHTNGAAFLDDCGYFDLKATVSGAEAGSVHAKVVPYDSFRTSYELFDELAKISKGKHKRYAEVGSIGQTTIDAYDIPYVVISDKKSSVDAWLKYTDQVENNPSKVLKDLKKGKYDKLRVPLYISNCHSNENSAVNGIMNFIQLLLTEDQVSLKTLVSYTDAGKAKLEQEKKEVFGTSLSSLIENYVTELGRLRGENGAGSGDLGTYGVSTVVDFEKYYNTKTETVDIDKLLDDVFFVCVPTMNMEGYTQGTRATGVGFDPNRDYANQIMNENINAMAFMGKWNPMVYTEIHGLVEGMLVEPCGAPHNPNLEYDLIAKQFIQLGEALGVAAVANNEKFNSFELPMRDYLEIDKTGNSPTGKIWGAPWDDLSTNFGAQFPVFYGTCGITWEMPAYDDITAEQVIPKGLIGQARYVAKNKIQMLTNQANIFNRGVKNLNSNKKVSKYYVNQYDVPNAQADLMRPIYNGKGENKNFYPEAYIIPLDKKHQRNIQDAAEMLKWLARNDIKAQLSKKAFTYKGVKYPKGTIVVPMYQAKRSLANANLSGGSYVTVWKGLYSEAFSQHPYARGFDIITVTKKADYKKIIKTCDKAMTYKGALKYLKDFDSQFSGTKNKDVIISNASEDAAAAVNTLLKSGKKVGMITKGTRMGDFIASYKDYKSVASKYILSALGVDGSKYTAQLISEAPEVYIIGRNKPATAGNIELAGGNSYCFDVYALKQMGFATTTDAAKADAIVGTGFGKHTDDETAKAEVLNGTPFMVWGSGSGLDGIVEGVTKESMSNGTDFLGYVKYPVKDLLNANYIKAKDYVMYQYGTDYFSAIPEGAKVLVQNAGKTPISGCIGIFDDAGKADFEKYNNGIVGFAYKQGGKDIVSFANTLDQKGHCSDEFKYISNFLFSRSLSDTAYKAA